MALSRGIPLPHSPGCPGRNHSRAGDTPCEAFRRERTRRKAARAQKRRGDCDCCPALNVPVYGHGGWLLCRPCYERWQRRGFTGNGPGPVLKYAALEQAREYAGTITRLSISQAADKLGYSRRTIVRWRKLLRENANEIAADT